MDVWICICYQKRRRLVSVVDKISSKLYIITKIVDSEEKADAWLKKAWRSGGPDLRLWIPQVIKQEVS